MHNVIISMKRGSEYVCIVNPSTIHCSNIPVQRNQVLSLICDLLQQVRANLTSSARQVSFITSCLSPAPDGTSGQCNMYMSEVQNEQH